MEVQITVASTTPGGADKKTSKITDTTGKTWYVYNNQFAQFQVGCSYLVTKYKTSDFKGATYYYIDAFTNIGGAAKAVINGAAPQAAPRYPVDNAKIDNERRMDIFICGAFNNIMANPNVHPLALSIGEMSGLVNMLRQVWLTTLGPNRPSPISSGITQTQAPAAALNPDMNDSIPF